MKKATDSRYCVRCKKLVKPGNRVFIGSSWKLEVFCWKCAKPISCIVRKP